MPALERAPGVDLMEEIRHLKREKNAVILAHNYQVKEIQEVADFVGDSLGLSVQAASTTADVIAFCGVHFMAETAKILNPNKKVILPDLDAGCSLADSCPGEALDSYLKKHSERNYYVIAYINCSAAVKALSDVIVTSGNAVRIVDSAPRDRNLLFVPDQNLGQWVIEQTGRSMELWKGACYVHVEFTRNSILKIKDAHPLAPVVAHPECTSAVRMLADTV
jgi:quinolinate synthase